MQRELGVAADGLIGPITLGAVKDCDVEKTVRGLCAARLAFIKRIKTYWRFGKGWTRRINGIRRAALERVGADDEPLNEAPVPLPSEDDQSATQGRADVERKPVDPKVAGGIGAAGAGAAGAASQTPIPEAPTGTVETLSTWQQAAEFFQSFGAALINHWEYFLLAGCIWGAVVYGIPAIYRKYLT